MEKMFERAFTGSPEGLTVAFAYHPETHTFEYGLQGYGDGDPGHFTYEESLDSDGNRVIRVIPVIPSVCAHCNYPMKTCYHSIDLVLAPDGRMVSVELMPRGIRLESNPGLTYQVGEDFDVDGATLRVIYEDERFEAVPLTADMISGYDSDKVGRQEVLVQYKRQSLSLTTEVKEADSPFEKTAPTPG